VKRSTINRTEVLRYLGHSGGALDAQVEAQLDRAAELVLELVEPRSVYRVFSLNRDGDVLRLQGTNVALAGEDILVHLEGADQCVLMAVTMGAPIETAIRRAQVADMALAVILNATADAAVEQICNSLQSEIGDWAKMESLCLGGRFSPGYGDMPLSQQEEICNLLHTARRIGVSVTSQYLLTPRKSITAVLGLYSGQIARRWTGCTACLARDNCVLRKAGRTCEKSKSPVG